MDLQSSGETGICERSLGHPDKEGNRENRKTVNRERSVNQISIQLQADDGSWLRVGFALLLDSGVGWLIALD